MLEYLFSGIEGNYIRVE